MAGPAEATSVGILATGSYVPETRIGNDFFASYLETSDDWIVRHTGIRERRFAKAGTHPSDLAIRAAKALVTNFGAPLPPISAVVLSTNKGDFTEPATAYLAQARLGIERAACFDIHSACMGFLNALVMARGMVVADPQRRAVLVLATEMPSRWNDLFDRSTCVFFGDGAGAVLVGPVREGEGLLSFEFESDGTLAPLTGIPAGGTRAPIDTQILSHRQQYGFMKGRAIYRHALERLPGVILRAVQQAGLSLSEIDLFVSHQANGVLLDEIRERLSLNSDRFFHTYEKYGNTSSASIPITLDEAVQNGLLNKGSNVAFFAIGAGMGMGATVVRWSKPMGDSR